MSNFNKQVPFPDRSLWIPLALRQRGKLYVGERLKGSQVGSSFACSVNLVWNEKPWVENLETREKLWIFHHCHVEAVLI